MQMHKCGVLLSHIQLIQGIQRMTLVDGDVPPAIRYSFYNCLLVSLVKGAKNRDILGDCLSKQWILSVDVL